MKKIIGLSVFALACAPAFAQTITSYDVEQAARSGFGNWDHLYSGTIVDTGNFTANGIAFTRADYSGGSGTLNDGLDGWSPSDTQLFANNADAQPKITLHLDNTYNITSITLFSFDGGNSIPGCISQCRVTIGNQSQDFTTSEQTANDEFIDLSNSPLSGLCTDTVTLSDFVHDGRQNGLSELFCIGEIRLRGQSCSSCPSDFTLTKGGTCPNSNSMAWSGAPANSTVRVLYTTNGGGGGTIPPNSPCPGTRLCIGLAGVTLHSQILHSDGNGGRSVRNFSAPCGLNIQLIAQNSCKTSNGITL